MNKTAFLLLGLIVSGLLVIAKVIGLAALASTGKPMGAYFVAKQVIYTICLAGAFIWCWAQLKQANLPAEGSVDKDQRPN